MYSGDDATLRTGDWSLNVLPDDIPGSPAAPVAPRLQSGDDTAPKTRTLLGHRASLQGPATRQDEVGSESAIVSRGVHGPFSIVVRDDALDGNGLVNGIVAGATSRVGGASSVIVSAVRGPDETDCEVPLDGIKSSGSAGEASNSGQLSLLPAGNHCGTAALQPKGQSPRQPRRLEAFAQMSERQAYEAFSPSQSGLSHAASAFHPGSGSLGTLDAANDPTLKNFVKDLDDAAQGSDPLREESVTLDYLGGGKTFTGKGFMSDEMSGYFSSMSLGAQRKFVRPPGTDMPWMDPNSLPDGLAPWSGADGDFPAAADPDRSGTPPHVAEFREGIGTALLEKLVEILRREPGGQLLASLAPERLYASVARGREGIAAAGGLRRFCLLYPAQLEFIADAVGRCRIRLRQSTAVDARHDGEGRRRVERGVEGTALTGVMGGEGGSEEPRKPDVCPAAVVARLVRILGAEGEDMSATRITSTLYKALPRAKEAVVAAGGLRKFCELFPADLEFVADPMGRCRVRARRRATKESPWSGRAQRAAVEAQGDSEASSRASSTERPAPQTGQSSGECDSDGNVNSCAVCGDTAMVAAAASSALAVGAPGPPPDSRLVTPMGKETITTLQRIVGILRRVGGEMYAARAPEVRVDRQLHMDLQYVVCISCLWL